MAERYPKAFFSYTRFDNDHTRGKLTSLRKRLEDELRGQLGTPFEIFQDIVDLNVGVDFQQRIQYGIDDALFFIPVVTPSYFTSKACRQELEAFRSRECSLLYEELIVPVYWIPISLPDDQLAAEIMTRNYTDFRKIRQKLADSPEMDEKIEELATQLIQRLHEFNDHHKQVSNLEAKISVPKNHEPVERYVMVTGTTENLPRVVTPWLAVEAGGRFHPQTRITSTTWSARVTIGTRGFGADNNVDFPIHVVAASKSAHNTFTKYLDEQQKQRKWQGVPLPNGARVLASVLVRRDDHTAALAKLIGTYDEFRALPPQPTGGTIDIKGTQYGRLAISAINARSMIEWSGSITVDSQTGEITGEYKNTKDNGQGTMQLKLDRDDINVTAQDRVTGAQPFFMAWRRRTP